MNKRPTEEQLAYQAKLLALVNDAIIASDADYTITTWNAAAEALYGWKAEEVIGQPGLDITRTDFGTNRDEMLRTIKENTVWRGEVTQARKDGTRFPVELSCSVLRDETGKVSGYVSVNRDITERKRAEEALRESKEQLALILDSAAEGIYGLDLQGNCTFCNSATLHIMGYREEKELLGRNIHDLAHHKKTDGTPYPREQCLVNEVYASGGNIHSDRETLWRSDGGSFPAEYWAHPMYKDGKLAGAVVTFIDRTEHAALEQQLLQAHKLEAVGQLAAGVAHDFNNILSAIIGHGHLVLLKMARDDPPRLNVESMLEASYQASRLVQSLLTVGRQHLIDRKPTDLNAVVAGATKNLTQAMGPGVVLKTAGGDEPLPVLADAGQIELVLQNLAANAVAAMPRGGTFTIATRRVVMDGTIIAAHGFGRPGPCALLSVSDTGTGMDEQTQKRIFEPFFSTKEFGKNTGLGLAVAYGVVKQHDGHIAVSSRPGTGTTFSIYLPLLDAMGDPQEQTKHDNVSAT